MSWREKTWGRVRNVVSTADCLVDYLEINPGGFSSVHKHHRWENRFYVSEGVVFLKDFSTDTHQRLAAGDETVIPAGHWHRFYSPDGCRVIESYYTTEFPRSVEEDIERR